MTAVGALFEDGTEVRGRMLFGCDDNRSRVRREMFGTEKSANQSIPVTMFDFTMQVTAEQAATIRALDPVFLQGTASANDVSLYTSRKFQTNYVNHRQLICSLTRNLACMNVTDRMGLQDSISILQGKQTQANHLRLSDKAFRLLLNLGNHTPELQRNPYSKSSPSLV